MPRIARDLTGVKYGRLTVVQRAVNNKNYEVLWLCQCDCGNKKVVRGYSLLRGDTKSCGCLANEKASKRLKKRMTTHGISHTRVYRIWSAMLARCYRKNHIGYGYWGGRGIRVCKQWRGDLKTFVEWAMKNGYRDDLQIDRVDNEKDYCPENCRFVTTVQQQRNRKSNRLVTYDGKTMTVSEFAERYTKCSRHCVYQRLNYGWSLDRIASTISRKHNMVIFAESE